MTAARPHTSPKIRVRRAVLLDLERVAPLFDQYRRFYDQPADLELARDFLSQRLERSESVILVGAVRLELATARTNHIAQALYEALGWVRNEEFHRYSLVVR